jgi:hypothetical protein
MTENQTLVTLFETNNQAIFSTAKSILDDEEIVYVTRGEQLWKNRILKLEVDSADEGRARKILKDVIIEAHKHSDPIIEVAKTKWYGWIFVLAVIMFLLYQVLKVINSR